MKKRIIALLLSFACLIAVGTYLVLQPVKQKPPDALPSIKQLQQEVQVIKTNHQAKITSLAKQNQQLVTVVVDTKFRLHDAELKANKLSILVSRLSKQTLHRLAYDTIKYKSACDSLQNKAQQYLQANAFKDSIAEVQVYQYEQLLTLKDSTIDNYANDYMQILNVNDSLVATCKLYQDQSKTYGKALLRQQRKHKWLTVGGTIVAGVAIATHIASIN